MTPNFPPADELALVRAEMRALAAREAELNQLMLSPGGTQHHMGTAAMVVVQRSDERVLDETKLPDWVLRNPAHYKIKHSQTVRVTTRAFAQGH